MNGIENTQKITVPAEREIATVTAWPDEVQVEIHAPDNNLTIDQARDLVSKITAAIEHSLRLDFEGEGDDFRLVERSA